MKTEAYEYGELWNAPFLVRLGENGDENSVIYCYFHQRFHAVLVQMIGEKVSKSVRFRMKTNQSGKVEKKTRTPVWSKILRFVFFQMKTETLENAQVWWEP